MQKDKKEPKGEGKEEAINDESQHVSGRCVTNTAFITITIIILLIIINNGTPFYTCDTICGEVILTVDWDEIAQTIGGLIALYFLLPFILNNDRFKPLYKFVEKTIIKWKALQD